jgi:hypothetical protein
MEPLMHTWAPDDDLEVGPSHFPRRTLTPADRARGGARALRWCAAVIALLAIVGGAMATFWLDRPAEFVTPWDSTHALWGQFLSSLAQPLGFAALVFGASYLLAIHATRLDAERQERVERERADQERVEREKYEPISRRGWAG